MLIARAPAARRMWAGLTSISGWGLRLRYALGNLFPSVDYMQGQYHIPHKLLVPLYYPYRWPRGLRRVG